MQTIITARHCKVPDQLRERARTVVERLGNLASQAIEMTVVFDTEGPKQRVELRLHATQGDVLVAKGEGVDHRTALDRAEEKLKRQVERASDRSRRARPRQPNNPL
jgi:ribosomal subunit interface protein